MGLLGAGKRNATVPQRVAEGELVAVGHGLELALQVARARLDERLQLLDPLRRRIPERLQLINMLQ
jgi:hypothetical protein